MNPKKALKELYKKYKKNNSYHKSEILFLIIQIKNDNNDLHNYNRSLYVDIKKFIEFYIKSTDKKDYGYDKIEIEKLTKAIDIAKNEKERYELCLYTSRLINLNGHENELNNFKDYKNECKTLSLKCEKSFKSKLNLISHLSSYNLKTIIIILLSIFAFSYLIFLPANFEVFEIFKLNYKNYSSNFYLNHLLNLISLAFGLEADKIIVPLNWFGVILLALLKSLYILVLLNYLYQKVINIIYEN
jgi:hypothetical protein